MTLYCKFQNESDKRQKTGYQLTSLLLLHLCGCPVPAVRLPVSTRLPLVLPQYDSLPDVASSAMATSKICLTREQASSPEFRVRRRNTEGSCPAGQDGLHILFAAQFPSPHHQKKPQAVISLYFLIETLGIKNSSKWTVHHRKYLQAQSQVIVFLNHLLLFLSAFCILLSTQDGSSNDLQAPAAFFSKLDTKNIGYCTSWRAILVSESCSNFSI